MVRLLLTAVFFLITALPVAVQAACPVAYPRLATELVPQRIQVRQEAGTFYWQAEFAQEFQLDLLRCSTENSGVPNNGPTLNIAGLPGQSGTQALETRVWAWPDGKALSTGLLNLQLQAGPASVSGRLVSAQFPVAAVATTRAGDSTGWQWPATEQALPLRFSYYFYAAAQDQPGLHACTGTERSCLLDTSLLRSVSSAELADGQWLTLFDRRADECLFSWAERSWPDWFSPSGQGVSAAADFYYRCYQGGACLATRGDRHVYVYRADIGLIDIGETAGWLQQAGCPALP